MLDETRECAHTRVNGLLLRALGVKKGCAGVSRTAFPPARIRGVTTAATLAVALLGSASAAAAQDGGSVTVTFGALDVDGGGLPDRQSAALLLTQPVSSETTLRFEIAAQAREEDAQFFGFGVRQELGGGSSLDLSASVSNSSEGIYPERALTLGYEFVTPPETGLVYRASLGYADFAADRTSLTARGEVVRFFPANPDGSFFVGQLGAVAVQSQPGAEIGYEVNAAGTLVRPDGWSFGLALATGTIGYEAFPGTDVANDFYSVRPFVSRRFDNGTEVTLGLEYVEAETFSLMGGSLGVKLDF